VIQSVVRNSGSRDNIANDAISWNGHSMHVTHDPAATASPTIDFDTFLAVDIRVGTIIDAKPFPEARKPAWRLWIDFGPAIGVRKSSAQITENHPLETLVGQQVAAVVNFPPRQIGPVVSEVLTLGFPDADGKVVLVQPSKPVPNGGRLFQHRALERRFLAAGGAPLKVQPPISRPRVVGLDRDTPLIIKTTD
jgi:tRNA-binding protein